MQPRPDPVKNAIPGTLHPEITPCGPPSAALDRVWAGQSAEKKGEGDGRQTKPTKPHKPHHTIKKGDPHHGQRNDLDHYRYADRRSGTPIHGLRCVAVANFTIASNPRVFNKPTGEWRDGDPLFMRCAIWRDAAENVTNSLSKGDRVIASGRLIQKNYETQAGEKRTSFELPVDEIGPSLKWATAKVVKATRSTSGGDEDPWASTKRDAARGNAPASNDEPPF